MGLTGVKWRIRGGRINHENLGKQMKNYSAIQLYRRSLGYDTSDMGQKTVYEKQYGLQSEGGAVHK